MSFFHGSNDGQKGMGLIMLILIGMVPTAYALNRAMPASQIAQFEANSQAASAVIGAKAAGYNVLGDPRPAVTALCRRAPDQRGHLSVAGRAGRPTSPSRSAQYGSIAKMPTDKVGNTRNDMYLVSEALRFLVKDKENDLERAGDRHARTPIKRSLDGATKFIPCWVKIVVAIALGLGTMVGWKRIVVTVGEKIGKTHLTYAQGACAEITAAATIAAADGYGLPVSTTHVLSSGIAGTMAANGSGLQWSTIRNIALAWVLTLPAAMVAIGHALLHLLASVLSAQRANRAAKKNPGAHRRRGFSLQLRYELYATKIARQRARLQLAVFAQHRAAFVADAPAMGGERRTALQQIAPGHAGGVVAEPARRPAGTAPARQDRSRSRRWRKGPEEACG